jgi:hypothetical protein
LDPPLFLGSCPNCLLFPLEIHAAGLVGNSSKTT